MSANQGLSARELLTETFSDLQNKLGGKIVSLPSKATAEIANDSDWHRTRIGYTGYELAVLVESGSKQWAIAFGTKCGSYPADPYNCDITAIPVAVDGKPEDQIAKEVHDALESNSYFRNSLIYAMADGQLAVSKEGRLGQKVLELLQPKVQEFIAQDLEIDSRYFTTDLRPVVKSAVRYKREFVTFLSETLQAALVA